MLDIKFIREHSDKVKKAAVDKGIDLDVDELLDLDQRRRSLLIETEALQQTKRAASKEIPKLSTADKKVKILEMQEVDARYGELKQQLRETEAEYDHLMLLVPNIPAPEAPIGQDSSANVAWSFWSPDLGHVDPKDAAKVAAVPAKFDFPIKDHIALGQELDLIDTEAGVKTSGFRGYYLKNEAVLIQQALLWHALNKLVGKGFTPMITPTLVREFALIGSGHFPAGKAEVYELAKPGTVAGAQMHEDPKAPIQLDITERMFLAGTSEPSLLAYCADRVYEEKDLPLKLCAISPCYRSEIGSYGKDTRGLYRIHEFMKVEQVVVCVADVLESEKWHETLREIAEEILQELKLPYRVVHVCTGDMGAGKYKQYDIETWMPSRSDYGETHSDSNLTDWQSRRLNIKYKGKDGKLKFAYTLNNTAIASPRILIPILENYQQKDGSVVVPEALKKYLNVEIIKSKST